MFIFDIYEGSSFQLKDNERYKVPFLYISIRSSKHKSVQTANDARPSRYKPDIRYIVTAIFNTNWMVSGTCFSRPTT